LAQDQKTRYELSTQMARVKEKTRPQVAKVKEKTRPWKEAIALVLAIAAAKISHDSASMFRRYTSYTDLIAYALALAFLVFATSAVLGISGKARAVFEPRIGSSHAAVIRYAILLVGVITTVIITLQLFGVHVGQLLIGGALTSVFVGIAAQQSLSNLFAGLVLLFSRPFHVGDAIRLKAGALGGQLDGVVTEIGITYIRLDTGETVLSIPNSQVLAAAVGPVPRRPEAPNPPPQADPDNPATRAPGKGTSLTPG
jgi:small-conductance mechanosensitive channel